MWNTNNDTYSIFVFFPTSTGYVQYRKNEYGEGAAFDNKRNLFQLCVLPFFKTYKKYAPVGDVMCANIKAKKVKMLSNPINLYKYKRHFHFFQKMTVNRVFIIVSIPQCCTHKSPGVSVSYIKS